MIPIPITKFVVGKVYFYAGNKYPFNELLCTQSDDVLLSFRTSSGGEWHTGQELEDKHEFAPAGWAEPQDI